MRKLWSEECRRKYIEPCNLEQVVHSIRHNKMTIATLNGSFDLLHAGHLQIIFEASHTADILIVALNSDSSIKAYKNPERPLIPLEYRLQMMAALEFVDYVTWFDETDPRSLLSLVKPDVHANGAEYGESCIEAATVKEHGGRIHVVQLVSGLSTTQIVQKISKIPV